MKKRLLLLFPLLLLFLFLPLTASAATAPEEYLDALWQGLPSLAREALPSDPADTAAIQEAVGVRHLFETVLSGLSGATPTIVSTLLTLLGVTLFFALLARLREGLGAGVTRAADAALGAALVLLAYDRFLGAFDRAAAYLSDLQTLAGVSAPVMGGLLVAGGNAATAASTGGAMAALSLLLEYLGGAALLPLLRIQLGFLLVSAIGEVKTDGVVATLRSLYLTVVGFFCMLITAAQAFGNAIGSAGDSLSLRTMRFAVGQMVPIVGGTVSGSLGTALASVALVRSVAGTSVAVAVLLPLIPVVVELLLSRFALSLLASAAGLLGAATPQRLFRSFRALFDLVLGAVVFSGLLFLFIAAAFARCAPAVL